MAACKSEEGLEDQYNLEDIYSFDTTFAGMEAIAEYHFTYDCLTGGKYIFKGLYSSNCAKNFEAIKAQLSIEYDKPVTSEKNYTASDVERRIYSDGELVKMGKLEMTATWGTANTEVILSLRKADAAISLTLEYLPKESDQHEEQNEQDDEQELQED